MGISSMATVAPGDTITSADHNIITSNITLLDGRTGGDPGAAGKIPVSSGSLGATWLAAGAANTVLASNGSTPSYVAANTLSVSHASTADSATTATSATSATTASSATSATTATTASNASLLNNITWKDPASNVGAPGTLTLSTSFQNVASLTTDAAGHYGIFAECWFNNTPGDGDSNQLFEYRITVGGVLQGITMQLRIPAATIDNQIPTIIRFPDSQIGSGVTIALEARKTAGSGTSGVFRDLSSIRIFRISP